MGSKNSGAPDPFEVASAQGASNVQTAIAQSRLNQVNETTPFGSSTYSPTGQTFTVKDAEGKDITVPTMQRDVTLSPDQQNILNLQNALTKQGYTIGGDQIGRIGQTLSSPLDFSGLPAAPQASETARNAVQDALYNRYTNMMDPRFDQERDRLRNELINSGHALGSPGYTQAMQDFNRSKNSAYENALFGAVAGGGAEQNRLFGLESAARNQGIQELFAQRNQPINELAALLGTSGGVNVPQFSGVPQTSVAPTDVAGPVYQSYAQDQANRGSTLGSIFGAVGTGLGAWLSDKDAKTDIEPASPEKALSAVQNMPMYDYRYKATGNRNIGPMAQDWAAALGGSGRTIEAPQAFGVSMAAIKALADKMSKLERRVA